MPLLLHQYDIPLVSVTTAILHLSSHRVTYLLPIPSALLPVPLLNAVTTTMSSQLRDIEKDHAAGGESVDGTTGYDLHHEIHDPDTALRRLRTAGSLSISPELFEKIYLSPKNQVSNNIRSTFGNPTPLYDHMLSKRHVVAD